MEMYIMKFKMEGLKINNREMPKLRGYLAKRFPEYEELHNHINNENYKYGYPFIQYKLINKVPNIVALNEAALTIYDVMNKVEEIQIESKIYKDCKKNFVMDKLYFGESESLIDYKFISPWMALNQNNFSKYKILDDEVKVIC